MNIYIYIYTWIKTNKLFVSSSAFFSNTYCRLLKISAIYRLTLLPSGITISPLIPRVGVNGIHSKDVSTTGSGDSFHNGNTDSQPPTILLTIFRLVSSSSL